MVMTLTIRLWVMKRESRVQRRRESLRGCQQPSRLPPCHRLHCLCRHRHSEFEQRRSLRKCQACPARRLSLPAMPRICHDGYLEAPQVEELQRDEFLAR